MAPNTCLYSSETQKNLISETVNKKKYQESKYQNDYVLGTGDRVFINFSGIKIFSKVYTIDFEGNLFLPEIGNIKASEKTLTELREILNQIYEEYIFEPDININISTYRPVNVIIKGEVTQPGLYTLYYETSDSLNNNDVFPQGLIKESLPSNLVDNKSFKRVPTLFDALKLSKGITNYADLKSIKVIRDNPPYYGGGKIATELDFLSLLSDGNNNVNIRLLDGDVIEIPRGEKMIKEQILSINKSNLTPEFISVYISGNIGRPGVHILKQGSSLIQGLYMAGGERYFTGRVKHLRFNDSGETEKNVFSLNLNAKANTKKNPILLDGDIIRVDQTILGKTVSVVENLANPITTTYGILNIFN